MKSAVLLVSHGTVDDLDDLAAFVTIVRRGHAPSEGLVAELRRRYETIGGKSPLNAISAKLAAKLATVLGARVAWANRLWKPHVNEVLAELAREGVRRVALVPLAQHSGHVYADDAKRAAEGTNIEIQPASSYGSSHKLCVAFASRIVEALASASDLAHTTIVMTAHSLPRSVIEAGDPYEKDVRAAADAIASLVRSRSGRDVRYTVAFQSQGMGGSGPGGRPVEWLGPNLMTTLDEARARGDTHVIFAPIGFLADHVEILYDLDIEARAMAAERGLSYVRARSLNADDDLVDALADVVRPLLGQG